MSLEKNFADIQPEDVGTVLVPAYPEKDPTAFGIDIVELAMKHGYDIQEDVWAADKPVFLSGDASYDMLEDLGVVVDFAIQYLEEQTPDGFYFEASSSGLVLRHADHDLTLE